MDIRLRNILDQMADEGLEVGVMTSTTFRASPALIRRLGNDVPLTVKRSELEDFGLRVRYGREATRKINN